jgi:hypothetical protein
MTAHVKIIHKQEYAQQQMANAAAALTNPPPVVSQSTNNSSNSTNNTISNNSNVVAASTTSPPTSTNLTPAAIINAVAQAVGLQHTSQLKQAQAAAPSSAGIRIMIPTVVPQASATSPEVKQELDIQPTTQSPTPAVRVSD